MFTASYGTNICKHQNDTRCHWLKRYVWWKDGSNFYKKVLSLPRTEHDSDSSLVGVCFLVTVTTPRTVSRPGQQRNSRPFHAKNRWKMVCKKNKPIKSSWRKMIKGKKKTINRSKSNNPNPQLLFLFDTGLVNFNQWELSKLSARFPRTARTFQRHPPGTMNWGSSDWFPTFSASILISSHTY